MTQCGPAACSLSAATCAANIGQQVIDVTLAVASTAALISTWGTAGAGATQAGRIAVELPTRALFKKAAKAAIAGFRKRVLEESTKAGILAAIKKAIKQQVWDLAAIEAHNIAVLAVEAIVNEIANSTDADMDNFDYTVFDPTGIANAVSKSLDNATSDIFAPFGDICVRSFQGGGCKMDNVFLHV